MHGFDPHLLRHTLPGSMRHRIGLILADAAIRQVSAVKAEKRMGRCAETLATAVQACVVAQSGRAGNALPVSLVRFQPTPWQCNFGALAQLGERRVCNAEVESSSLSCSTKMKGWPSLIK